MKVETIVKFHDLKEDCIREIGEQFTASKDRCRELEKRGYIKRIEILEETAAE